MGEVLSNRKDDSAKRKTEGYAVLTAWILRGSIRSWQRPGYPSQSAVYADWSQIMISTLRWPLWSPEAAGGARPDGQVMYILAIASRRRISALLAAATFTSSPEPEHRFSSEMRG